MRKRKKKNVRWKESSGVFFCRRRRRKKPMEGAERLYSWRGLLRSTTRPGGPGRRRGAQCGIEKQKQGKDAERKGAAKSHDDDEARR